MADATVLTQPHALPPPIAAINHAAHLDVKERGMRFGIDCTRDVSVVAKAALTGLTILSLFTGVGAIAALINAKTKTYKFHQMGAVTFSAILITACALTPIVGWGILYIVKISLQKNAEATVKFQEGIAQKALTKLRQHLDIKLGSEFIFRGHEGSPESCLTTYANLRHRLHKQPSSIIGPTHVGPQYDTLRSCRRDIDKILSNQDFIALAKANPNHPFVVEMRDLAHIVRQQVEGQDSLREYGKECLDYGKVTMDSKDSYTMGETARYIEQAIEGNAGITGDTIVDKAASKMLCPTKAICSLGDKASPSTYNSNKYGNANMHGWDYEIDGTTMAFNFGATPTGDTLFEADIERAEAACTTKGEYKGPIFLQINLQKSHGDEGIRTDMLHQMGDTHPALRVMTFPMDGKAWHMKGELATNTWSTPGEFCKKYKKVAVGTSDAGKAYRILDHDKNKTNGYHSLNNGFYIPKEVLSDKAVEEAFDATARALGANTNITRDKYEAGRAMQLTSQVFISLAAMEKAARDTKTNVEELADAQLQQLHNQATLGQACKQDIDRGVAQNILTRIFYMRAKRQPITKEAVQEIIGAVIGRAKMVDRRMILRDRIAPALTALEMIDKNPDRFDTELRNYLEFAKAD